MCFWVIWYYSNLYWFISFLVSGSIGIFMIFNTIQCFSWNLWYNSIEPHVTWFWLGLYVSIFFESYQTSYGFNDTIQNLAFASLNRFKLHLKIIWYDSMFLWFVSIFMLSRLMNIILHYLNRIMLLLIWFKHVVESEV